MENKIIWRNLTEAATDEMIQAIELALKIKFPTDFLDYARLYHGASS